jgi:hypothetical protein
MVVRACIAVREGGRDDSPRSLPWMELVAPGWELLWFIARASKRTDTH